jgi:hypothetical protein
MIPSGTNSPPAELLRKLRFSSLRPFGFGKQNPYIKEELTTQWPSEKYKRTNNGLQNIHIKPKIE